MIRQLLYKWFGLTDPPCETCEVLREQLASSERERRDLLARLLEKDKSEPLVQDREAPEPITPQFIPWRVRQQLLEQEDRKAAALLRDKKKEIDALEKELGVGANVDNPAEVKGASNIR